MFRIIDANALGYAQYFLREKRVHDGRETHAIAGFLEHVRGRLQFDKDVCNIITWDGRAQWRYDLLPGYKSSRKATPEQRAARASYEAQRDFIRQALRWFPVIQVLHPCAEADDTGYGLARQLAAQGHLVTLSTSDTDWLQTVAARVRWANAKKLTHIVELDGFAKATGFASPKQYAQAKALAGDDTDDIDGVPDVALKRAKALLGKYGSLEAVLEAAEDILAFSQEPAYFHALLQPAVRERVRRNARLVDLSQGPALYGQDVEVEVGALNELELMQTFFDHGFHEYLDNWSYWERPLSRGLVKANTQSVLRAVQNLHASWPQG